MKIIHNTPVILPLSELSNGDVFILGADVSDPLLVTDGPNGPDDSPKILVVSLARGTAYWLSVSTRVQRVDATVTLNNC